MPTRATTSTLFATKSRSAARSPTSYRRPRVNAEQLATGQRFIELFGRKAQIGKVKMDPLDAMVIWRALAILAPDAIALVAKLIDDLMSQSARSAGNEDQGARVWLLGLYPLCPNV